MSTKPKPIPKPLQQIARAAGAAIAKQATQPGMPTSVRVAKAGRTDIIPVHNSGKGRPNFPAGG